MGARTGSRACSWWASTSFWRPCSSSPRRPPRDPRLRHPPARARSRRARLRDPVRADHGALLHRLDQRRQRRPRGGARDPDRRDRVQPRLGHRRRGHVPDDDPGGARAWPRDRSRRARERRPRARAARPGRGPAGSAGPALRGRGARGRAREARRPAGPARAAAPHRRRLGGSPGRVPARVAVHLPGRPAVPVRRAARDGHARLERGRDRDALRGRPRARPACRLRAGAHGTRDGRGRCRAGGDHDGPGRLSLLMFTTLALLLFAPVQAQDPLPVDEHLAAPERWEFSGSLFYSDPPGSEDRLTPIVYANRGAVHLEARYNYEDLETLSLFAGWTVSLEGEVEADFTPLLGAAFGETSGIAPALEVDLGWRRLAWYAETEYLFDLDDRDDD